MKSLTKLITILALFLGVKVYGETMQLPLTQEELRLTKLKTVDSTLLNTPSLSIFEQKWRDIKDYAQAKKLLQQEGNSLWQKVKLDVISEQRYDDRPLYWQRLAIKAKVKQIDSSFSHSELNVLLEVFEMASRGYSDIDYKQGAVKHIFITGFDPFLLDKNITQSNPSGLAALALDGKVINYKGVKAEINAVIVPVRYDDFDQGEIESLLAPIYLGGTVDLVATVSMGREQFDLERFPAKRRSVEVPDNLNHFSGGSKTNPVISQLANKQLSGPEFVEFNLPVAQMKKAVGNYQINDNRKIVSLEKGPLSPDHLSELDTLTAVSGSGGGYLSNEISYRSIRLKNKLGVNVPTGHIHTPRISSFEYKTNKAIVQQIESMLSFSIEAI
jgi:pyrrolidone-carboxylate peptidase